MGRLRTKHATGETEFFPFNIDACKSLSSIEDQVAKCTIHRFFLLRRGGGGLPCRHELLEFAKCVF